MESATRDLLDRLLREEFEPTILPKAWEWSVIGDNWLWAWSFARGIEQEHGIDHQETLRVIDERYRQPALVSLATPALPEEEKHERPTR